MPRHLQGSGIALDRSSSLINNRFSDPYSPQDLESTNPVAIETRIPMIIPPGFWIPLGALVTAKSHAGLGRAAGGGSYCLMSPVPASPPVKTLMSSQTPPQQLLGDVRSEPAEGWLALPVTAGGDEPRLLLTHRDEDTGDNLSLLRPPCPAPHGPQHGRSMVLGALDGGSSPHMHHTATTKHPTCRSLPALLQLPTGSRWPWMQGATGTGKWQS